MTLWTKPQGGVQIWLIEPGGTAPPASKLYSLMKFGGLAMSFFNSPTGTFWKGWYWLNIRFRSLLVVAFCITFWVIQVKLGPTPHVFATCTGVLPFLLVFYLNYRLMAWPETKKWWWWLFTGAVVISAFWNPPQLHWFHRWSTIDLLGIMFLLPTLFHAKRMFWGK